MRFLMVFALSALPAAGQTVGSVPLSPSRGWAILTEAGTEGSANVTLAPDGASVRVRAIAATELRRAGWQPKGPYTVRATFRPAAASAGPYGLTLRGAAAGGAHLVVLLRADGACAIERHAATVSVVRPWDACRPVRAPADRDRLEVRVTAQDAEVRVDGVVLATVPLAPRELEGAVGVHVGMGADVAVSALQLQQAAGGGQP